jgi:predicted nucleotide-binding protein (sugar kinase/HSP70/actin superfamily)
VLSRQDFSFVTYRTYNHIKKKKEQQQQQQQQKKTHKIITASIAQVERRQTSYLQREAFFALPEIDSQRRRRRRKRSCLV